jgi:hypothetical protein
VLGDVCDGATILATEAEALDYPQTKQNDRRRQADRLEVGINPIAPVPRAMPVSAIARSMLAIRCL